MSIHTEVFAKLAERGYAIDGLHTELTAQISDAEARGLRASSIADEIAGRLEQVDREMRASAAHRTRKEFEVQHGAAMAAGDFQASALIKQWNALHDAEIAAAQEATPPPSAQSVSDADRASARAELDKLRADPEAARELRENGPRELNKRMSPLIDKAAGIAR